MSSPLFQRQHSQSSPCSWERGGWVRGEEWGGWRVRCGVVDEWGVGWVRSEEWVGEGWGAGRGRGVRSGVWVRSEVGSAAERFAAGRRKLRLNHRSQAWVLLSRERNEETTRERFSNAASVFPTSGGHKFASWALTEKRFHFFCVYMARKLTAVFCQGRATSEMRPSFAGAGEDNSCYSSSGGRRYTRFQRQTSYVPAPGSHTGSKNECTRPTQRSWTCVLCPGRERSNGEVSVRSWRV